MSRILVVEDDTNINEVVCEYLREAGFESIPFLNGSMAKEFIQKTEARIQNEGKIDLFILDIMLPGLSGLTLLKFIRDNEAYCHTPVVMLTALGDEETQTAGFDGLADDYVTKPFSPKILVKRVQALLRRAGGTTVTAGGAESVLRIGSISMDCQRYEVLEDSEKVALTYKEFELLKIMAQNRQKVLSRQQLLDLVWGYDYYGDDRIIDVHIKNLRKKFRTDVIVTVKGVGYKID
jgi:DNA-binding response OmpR family regulator